VLLDRDGTLIHDVPYLADPERVAPVDDARDALAALRQNGLLVGVVSNQSGVARGFIRPDQLSAVNSRVDSLLGPFETWQTCPHGPDEGCECRKPRPGLVLAAARDLGVDPSECLVIGDIGADVQAALRAGARAVLVPTPVTRPGEVAYARTFATVASSLSEAVDHALAGAR
jgi:histidinol-phosphate phosphatase family protein